MIRKTFERRSFLRSWATCCAARSVIGVLVAAGTD
jgi:hypothetical protein